MLDSVKKGPFRSLSTTQQVVIGVVVLVLLFMVIGTINQSTAPEPAFSFGLQTQPFLALGFLAFAAGLLSFASPCTLPILPAYFAFAFQSGRKQIALNTLVFMLGLATTFSILGAGASVIGRTLRQNQQLILLIGGSLILAFGVMSLLGKGFTGLKHEEEREYNTSLGGSYLFGLTFAVGWSSCVGPILGTVLTMAGTAGSVVRGMMLLFIYALGLGLPLILVSTFFGRASRQSLFWRALRGKGWTVTGYATLIMGLVWSLAIWRILVAAAAYAFQNFDAFAGQELTIGHQVGLLVIAIIGMALWILTSPGKKDGQEAQLQLHSTQLISGVLFIVMGLLMLNGTLATFNSLVPTDWALWFADLEDKLITLFGG
ncbi:MAG: cytochrome c biogenesis CcdA family protein [Chloroflexi bacterium]|nr:cytochrome c biogenesis CcdA family protein [Chloroflexota bacterium]MCI0578349.1 cytochrome c biogenesis CcdA family protein [Chloroflexota bacterium]MCI0646248.1 cytochrome c biogenesis CcdA family protein [Chloroflexota bacterium]MCI0732132.1 cytochrome c biogenesis CcdA family protein [Chloroflexota bacterium]